MSKLPEEPKVEHASKALWHIRLVHLELRIRTEAVSRRWGMAIIWAQLLIAGDIAWRVCHDDGAPLAAFYVYQCLNHLIQLEDVVSHILQ